MGLQYCDWDCQQGKLGTEMEFAGRFVVLTFRLAVKRLSVIDWWRYNRDGIIPQKRL